LSELFQLAQRICFSSRFLSLLYEVFPQRTGAVKGAPNGAAKLPLTVRTVVEAELGGKGSELSFPDMSRYSRFVVVFEVDQDDRLS